MDNDNSLWSKKQDELTVGDSMKVMGVVMIVSVVAPLVTFAGIGIGINAYEKLQDRRKDRKAKKDK